MTARPDGPAAASFVGKAPDLDRVRRVLLVRLRSIGDTVLMTPCISALKSWRPDVEVDILLEPFCAPVLESHAGVDRVIEVEPRAASRARVARSLGARGYDMAINLSGGTTGALLSLASRARVRVGFSGYRYARLANCRVTSSNDVWRRDDVHTVEHQLALVAGVGVPVAQAPPTSLAASPAARARVAERLERLGLADSPFALVHPEAAFEAKQWPAENFARVCDRLAETYDLRAVVVGRDADLVVRAAGARGLALPDAPLADVLALAERASLFVGNDSGPAHVAAAFAVPLVVVFGPSNERLWRPWSRGPWRTVLGGATAAGAPLEAVESAIAEVLGESAERASAHKVGN